MRCHRLLVALFVGSVLAAGCASHSTSALSVSPEPFPVMPKIIQNGQPPTDWVALALPNGMQSGPILAGADGNMWFGTSGGAGRIDMTGNVKLFPTPIGFGTPIVGPDEAFYFFGLDSGTPAFGRLTVGGSYNEIKLTVQVSPQDFAFGKDGRIWFGYGESDNQCHAFAVTLGGSLTDYGPMNLRDCGPVLQGPDKNVWMLASSDGSKEVYVRINSSGVSTIFNPSPPPGNGPGALGWSTPVDGPDGNMWFTTTAYVGNITTSGVATYYPLNPHAPHNFKGMTREGQYIWFIDASFNKELIVRAARVTMSGKVDETRINATIDGPVIWGVAGGPDGNIWVSDKTFIGVFVVHPITASPSSLTITHGTSQSVTASEKDVRPVWTASSNDVGIATVTALGGGAFSVMGVAPGTCTIAISDGHGNSIEVPVTVQ